MVVVQAVALVVVVAVVGVVVVVAFEPVEELEFVFDLVAAFVVEVPVWVLEQAVLLVSVQ